MNDTITVIQIAAENASKDMQGEFAHFIWRACSVHSAIVILALLIAGYLWYKHRVLIQKYVSPKNLLWASLFIFFCGTFIYTIGSLRNETMDILDALYTIPSAIISSLGMFFYQDDISELTDEVKGNSIFMASYSLAHFFAAIIMSFVILRLLGMRIVYWLKMKDCSKYAEKLYVFWGINRPSLVLAKSIRDVDKSSYIVFVNTIDDEGDINSIHRLLDIIKIKSNVDERVTEIDAIMVNCYEDIADHSDWNGFTLSGMISRGAKLNYLAKAIKRSCELHLFFLSNNEDLNINSANNVIKVVEEEYNKKYTQRKTHIYCHAHHSAKTQSLDYHDIVKFDLEPKVHVVDSSALAVACLKSNISDCPVSFVKVDEATATVASPFRSMIIGFGETGKETFKFLYEFGAFVGDKGRKSPFHCTIIDEKVSQIVGDFYAECPAMKNKTDDKSSGDIVEKEIRFEECPVGSSLYWDLIKEEIEKGINYIMVSVNDDDLGFETAVNICRKSVEWHKEGNDQLNIYVRCTKQENYERLADVAKEMAGRYGSVRLKVFGDIRTTFAYDTIVNDINLRRAKEYNAKYSSSETMDLDQCWIKELKLLRTKGEPTISNIEDSIRRRDQNISNVLHASTKINLLERTGKGIEYWRSRKRVREKDTPHYQNLSGEEKAMLINLARLEHERWIAASLLQGWQAKPISTGDKDERRKLHPDIHPWDTLRSEGAERLKYQGYDCDVVDTTIKIELEKRTV